ncbi:hypothetical protein ES288_A11G333200v1 [Gossypium darwinii]|uniref:Uncharacterized protein n=2 Tax=Gossypium TaxID=3633 RepID=A0A5D2NGS6_GOSTO|nr:hypothetical protein ES288_A11G333200v1 [Gossypium darwinii]TYI03321.1 hypothetical protein ES332_A11G330100v1 [Gossypium tomentosum]
MDWTRICWNLKQSSKQKQEACAASLDACGRNKTELQEKTKKQKPRTREWSIKLEWNSMFFIKIKTLACSHYIYQLLTEQNKSNTSPNVYLIPLNTLKLENLLL